MTDRIAVYAGSFDLLTNGHLWMIEQGARLFDKLFVSVGINPDKKCLFSVDDRLAMLKQTVSPFPNVETESFPFQYLINYAKSKRAQFILRGIRTISDYETERSMRYINADFDQQVTTVFLIPPRELVEVSSSMVKGLVGPQGWEVVVRKYLPHPVFHALIRSYYARNI